MKQETVVLKNVKVVTEDRGVIENGFVVWEGERLAWVGSAAEFGANGLEPADAEVIDGEGAWALPGFIDVHVHGGAGGDFMDASAESYKTITGFHGRHGTTAMLATTVTAPREAMERVIVAASAFHEEQRKAWASGGAASGIDGGAGSAAGLVVLGGAGGVSCEGDVCGIGGSAGSDGAELIGVHLEGPFISPKWPGAQNPAFIVDPQTEWLDQWTREFPGVVKLLTLAPERTGAYGLIRLLRERGVVAACGHTDASYDCIEEAVEHGLSHAVHTFNAMKGLHHREPGTVGAVMSDDRITAEVIADGHHVHPACIKMLVRQKGPDRLILITDAMAAAGLGDGTYDLGGLAVRVQGGVARLAEGDSLAGSTLTMIDAFRFVIRNAGVDVPLASRLASGNPARQLGLDAEMGSLAAGKLANVLLVSPSLELKQVWVHGQALN